MSAPRTALITGANSGIGLALATELQQQGYQVIATARRDDAVAKLAAAGFLALPLDVNDTKSRQALRQALQARGLSVDLLVNNAGFGAMGPVLDFTEQQWQAQFATNLFAVALVTKELLPLLEAAQGRVLNIGSVSASLVTPFAGAYCASKAALHAISEAMQMELAPLGVAVQWVVTGAVDTGFAARASAELQWLSEQSPWWRFRDGITRRANASQDFPTSAAAYAKALVKQLQRPPTRSPLYVGRGARLLPWLKRWLPWPLLSWILSRKFGLSAPTR
ncbi:MAG TPA: short-chain dehydrogenase [Rheinheimera sp.]|nr:short-chain dehydrogenase [Rheinheimera sp.]